MCYRLRNAIIKIQNEINFITQSTTKIICTKSEQRTRPFLKLQIASHHITFEYQCSHRFHITKKFLIDVDNDVRNLVTRMIMLSLVSAPNRRHRPAGRQPHSTSSPRGLHTRYGRRGRKTIYRYTTATGHVMATMSLILIGSFVCKTGKVAVLSSVASLA